MDSPVNALNVKWIFGFSKDIIGGVQSLSKSGRNALFSISAHCGIIYDYEYRSQTILQGHCNFISCCAISKDKRWIVTSDCGAESILVIWDSLTGAPVKTLFTPHENGVISLDISDDALYIVTLGAPQENSTQEIAVWAWTRESDAPLLKEQTLTSERQHEIKFNIYNQSEIVVTSSKTVSFWNWKEFSLEGYNGRAAKADFGHYSGKFTSTIFFAERGSSAATATDEGFVIVWGSQFSTILLDNPANKSMKMATKVIRLVECAVNTMRVINNYIAVGCSDGAVRFYDFSLRLEAWFEDLAAGSITSLSFSLQNCPFSPSEGGQPGLKFWVPDFTVGTADAFIVGMESTCFDEISPDDRRGTLLVQGVSDEISCVACHPHKTLVAMTCFNGSLQVWDYEMKLLMNLREFNSRQATQPLKLSTATGNRLKSLVDNKFLRPQCCTFDPLGEFIVIGFTTGEIRFYFVESYDDLASFSPSSDVITQLKFSKSGTYLAASDSSHHVIIFRKEKDESRTPNVNGRQSPETAAQVSEGYSYIYLGRILAHSEPICGIEFGTRENGEVLISVGKDRRCVEYNLASCSIKNGITICDVPIRIELTATPTAVTWHPQVTKDDLEDRFVVANDEFKLKEFNADSKQCRRTTLAPSFGSPPTTLLNLTIAEETQNYVYATEDRIVGIGTYPLSGNPVEVMGLVAHPAQISSIALSYDGKYLFTAGGRDLTTAMWDVDVSVLNNPNRGSPEDAMLPFLELLEGGNNGELHNDIIDYFYLCQLRTQGENTMDIRAVTGRILVDEIPSLFRAVGYYPSEEEIENICNEIKYKNFMSTGLTQNDISLDEVIKLYVNHRPVNPLSSADIDDAFETIKKHLAINGRNNLTWADVKTLLLSEGEVFVPNDLALCLDSLLGDKDAVKRLETSKFNSVDFASKVLGFDDSAEH